MDVVKIKQDDIYVQEIIVVMLEINFMELVLNLWCNNYPLPLCHNLATIHTGNIILRHYLLNTLPKPWDLEKKDCYEMSDIILTP